MGRLLLSAAFVLAVLGVVFLLVEKHPAFRLGRLPGDIVVERENSRFYFPITSMLLVSLLLSAGLMLLRFFKR